MDHTYSKTMSAEDLHLPSTSSGNTSRPSVIHHTGALEIICNTTDRRGWTSGIASVPNATGEVVIRAGEVAADIYFQNLNSIKSVEFFLLSTMHILKDTLASYLGGWRGVKYSLWLESTFAKPTLSRDHSEFLLANFKTKTQVLVSCDQLDDFLWVNIEDMLAELESFEKKGSGWTLLSVGGILLKITKYRPLKGGAIHIPLPRKIRAKGAVINVVNWDEYCFKYAVLGSLTSPGEQNTYNPSFYLHLQESYDFSGLQFPVEIKDVGIFEQRNNLSVNIYALDDGIIVYPLRISPIVNLNNTSLHIDLLYLQSGDSTHYCYIRNLSRLVNRQLTRHATSHVICKRCFKTYNTDCVGKPAEQRLEDHLLFCRKYAPCQYQLPKLPKVKFNKFKFHLPVPVVIYADIECMLQPTNPSCPRSERPNTQDVHIPTCAGFYVKSYYQNLIENKLTVFTGADCITDFLNALHSICKDIEFAYKTNIPINWSPAELQRHQAAKNCDLCRKLFNRYTIKVADHDHLNGRYRYTLCQKCNLQLKLPNFVPVYFHNLSGYDSHFIVKHLKYIQARFEVIAESSERYISFSIKFEDCRIKIRFLDSFRFLSASLASLVQNLNSFPEMTSVFPNDTDRSHLLRKGVYPYGYIKSWEVLEERSLPLIQEFYSELTEEHISDADYKHARNVWNHFKLGTLFEYTVLYLKSDIILLCDVFETYRVISRNQYGLDPSWSFTSPGFFWQVMLKMTGVELDLLTDIDMLQFIESGIRGGITQCVKRHVAANNPMIPETYDPSKSSNFILYVDVNNLYGFVMSQCLPTGEFRWLEDEEIENFNILTLPTDGEQGYVLDVSISYPPHLHDSHVDFPYFPESMKPPGASIKKLMTTQFDKDHYVSHYINLQQGIRAGLIVRTIHRVLTFKQSRWLAPYIDFNTQLRMAATSEFDKDYYKLANNSVFGRSMMNKRKFKDFRLVTSQEELLKLAKKPNFNDRYIYEETLIGVLMDRVKIKFDSPIYVGFTILELSKIHMYHIYYDRLLPTLGGKSHVDLCYMDTDSLILDVETSNIYEDLHTSLSDLMDFSNYPNDHPCFSDVNKKVVGKLKDEAAGVPIKEFIGLRPKLYSLKFGNQELSKAKGIKKSTVKNHLSFDDFKKTLDTGSSLSVNFSTLSSKLHVVHTLNQQKTALSFFDDKRQILSDRVRTIPHGYRGSIGYELLSNCETE